MIKSLEIYLQNFNFIVTSSFAVGMRKIRDLLILSAWDFQIRISKYLTKSWKLMMLISWDD